MTEENIDPSELDTSSTETNRSGIQALYSFTPFRLQNSNPYELLLPPVSWLRTEGNRYTEYRSNSTRDEFDVPKSGPDEDWEKPVVQPHSLYTEEFSENSSNEVIYRHRNYKNTSEWNYPPMYAEFSYEALEATRFCQRGWVISASDNQCPMRKYCPDFTGGEQCEHYEGPLRFDQLYKIYPGIVRQFQDPTSGSYDYTTGLKYGDSHLGKLSFTNSGQFHAFIDEVIFNSQPNWMFASPSIYTQEGIGFRTENVNALQLNFKQDTFRRFIHDLLSENPALRNWIALKYILYVDPDYVDQIRDRGGFDAFDDLTDAINVAMVDSPDDEGGNGGSEDSSEDNDDNEEDELDALDRLLSDVEEVDFDDDELAIEFAETVFIHTVAHAFRDWFVNKYGCDHDHIEYYLDHPDLGLQEIPSEKKRIVLFESAIGGFGYLDDFRRDLEKQDGGVSFESFLSDMTSFLQRHRSNVEKTKTELPERLDQYDSEDAADILEGYQALESLGIYPHSKSVRQALHEKDNLGEKGERQRALLDDMFQHGPTCWDGCAFCVDDTKDCSFLPFDRPFLISRELAFKGLGTILAEFNPPRENTLSSASDPVTLIEATGEIADDHLAVFFKEIDENVVEDLYATANDEAISIDVFLPDDSKNSLSDSVVDALYDCASDTSLISVHWTSEGPSQGTFLIDQCISVLAPEDLTYDILGYDPDDIELDYNHHHATSRLKNLREHSEKWESSPT